MILITLVMVILIVAMMTTEMALVRMVVRSWLLVVITLVSLSVVLILGIMMALRLIIPWMLLLLSRRVLWGLLSVRVGSERVEIVCKIFAFLRVFSFSCSLTLQTVLC